MKIPLPSPDGEIALQPTLGLVAALEQDCGSIFLLAEKLATRALPLTDIFSILHVVYLHAGYPAGKEALAAFFFKNPAVAAPVLLAHILATLILPLQEIGVIPPGEA